MEEVGTYQWIPAGELVNWELDGWIPVARQSRFHWDSFLMFKPAVLPTPSEPCSKTEGERR